MIIVTDSAADITRQQAQQMNVRVVPLTITFESGVCPQQSQEDFDRFYQLLAESRELPATSQPTPQLYLEIYEQAKAAGEQVLVIALSSGLSGTCASAQMAATLLDYDEVYVFDSRQAIQAQRMLVEQAVVLREKGLPAAQIVVQLESLRQRIHVMGVLDSLVCLRKGGRIPAAAAILGDLIELKPLIRLEDATLSLGGKTRGSKAAIRLLGQEFEKARRDQQAPVYFSYTSNRKRAEAFMEDMCHRFGLCNVALHQICGVIGTHLGPDTVAVAYVEPEE